MKSPTKKNAPSGSTGGANEELYRNTIHQNIGNSKRNQLRCSSCGRYIRAADVAGYEHDRVSDRGKLICERCFVEGVHQ